MGAKLYAGEHVERYVDDQIYAFTRGEKGEVNTLYCVHSTSGAQYIIMMNIAQKLTGICGNNQHWSRTISLPFLYQSQTLSSWDRYMYIICSIRVLH